MLQEGIRGGSGEGIYGNRATYWDRELTSDEISFGRPRVEDSGWNTICFGAICVDGESMGQ